MLYGHNYGSHLDCYLRSTTEARELRQLWFLPNHSDQMPTNGNPERGFPCLADLDSIIHAYPFPVVSKIPRIRLSTIFHSSWSSQSRRHSNRAIHHIWIDDYPKMDTFGYQTQIHCLNSLIQAETHAFRPVRNMPYTEC
jgi:hypothetical protein